MKRNEVICDICRKEIVGGKKLGFKVGAIKAKVNLYIDITNIKSYGFLPYDCWTKLDICPTCSRKMVEWIRKELDDECMD